MRSSLEILDSCLSHLEEGHTRLEFPCPLFNFSQLLDTHTPTVYWSSRDEDEEVMGFGIAESYDDEASIQRCLSSMDEWHPNTKYYGAFTFPHGGAASSLWKQWNQMTLILPRFEWRRKGKEVTFAYHSRGHGGWDEQKVDLSIPKLLKRIDVPNKDQWINNLQKAIVLMEKTELEKVVLARQTTLHCSHACPPGKVILRLKEQSPNAFHFCFTHKGESFLGASPERLYKREGLNIISEAIAGTVRRGKDTEEDFCLGAELLASQKDQWEHHLVASMLDASLKQHCHQVKRRGAPTLLKLATVQHLYTPFRGRLRAVTSDLELIRYLHPTPAIGGFPKKLASQVIRDIEPFDRGMYSGLVAWFSRSAAEFVVAIRSGLIQGDQCHLFAGAGIVAASQEELEWDEINYKLDNFMRIFS